MEIITLPQQTEGKKRLRVAAYARVSKDKDSMAESLEAQTSYYETYINNHPDWELIQIYADYGVSGMADTRPAFIKMMEEARSNRFDLIITKSVTRFARNTVTLLSAIRELKELGIRVYFEKEHLDSISSDGELLLTLLSMYAEEEARSMSENVKWKVKQKFEKGLVWNDRMLGYRQVNGKLCVVPEEAEIVRTIYSLYLSGLGTSKIARYLDEHGIKPKRAKKWSYASVLHILKNEKYTGNTILQKTYSTDLLTKTRALNYGERPKYYVENSHEPIIDQTTFDEVARIREARFKKCGYYGKCPWEETKRKRLESLTTNNNR